MNLESLVQREADGDQEWVFITAMAAPTDSPANEDEITRSAQNIREWMAYLPRNCVETMIRMGWDKTT
jgi:hypothetical protein